MTIALNVLHTKKEKIRAAYVAKHKWNREVILLMISNGEKHDAKSEGREAKSEGQRLRNYLAVRKYQYYQEEQRLNITMIFII